MSTKWKVIISIAALALAFALGYWLTPTKTITKVETITVQKIIYVEKKHADTTTVVVTKPDGTTESTTHTVEDTNTSSNTTEVSDTTNLKETSRDSAKVAVLALAGVPIDFNKGVGTPVYGLSVSRPIIGPVTVGLWGLSNLTFGVGVGLSF